MYMITEKFKEVISYEGAVSITTWTKEMDTINVSNTWNSYITVVSDNRFLIPAAGMNKTEANVIKNSKVKITVGSKEVKGLWTQGAGFLINGEADFIVGGPEYDMMKEKFPFLTRVLAITISSIKQTL